MKIIIDIPEKTYQKIKEGIYDYGDMNVIIQNGTPYEKRPHGEWIEVPKYKGFYACSKCLERLGGDFWAFDHWEMRKENFCPVCGSDNRKRGEAE